MFISIHINIVKVYYLFILSMVYFAFNLLIEMHVLGHNKLFERIDRHISLRNLRQKQLNDTRSGYKNMLSRFCRLH